VLSILDKPMNLKISRVLRTASSERYIVETTDGTDVASLDLHYLPDGNVQGTLILLVDEYAEADKTSALLEQFDQMLLPEVSAEENNLSFFVVKGEPVGQFTAE
jgi:hypothetical protein